MLCQNPSRSSMFFRGMSHQFTLHVSAISLSLIQIPKTLGLFNPDYWRGTSPLPIPISTEGNRAWSQTLLAPLLRSPPSPASWTPGKLSGQSPRSGVCPHTRAQPGRVWEPGCHTGEGVFSHPWYSPHLVLWWAGGWLPVAQLNNSIWSLCIFVYGMW